MEKVFNRQAAAEWLGISVATLDRYRADRILSYVKIGDRVLLREKSLTALLDACNIPAIVDPSDRQKLEIAKAIGGAK